MLAEIAAPTPRTESRWREISSQVTPVSKILADAKKNNLLEDDLATTSDYRPPGDIATPETPLGAFMMENPTRSLRKEFARYINKFPEFKPRRDSTVCNVYFVKVSTMVRLFYSL